MKFHHQIRRMQNTPSFLQQLSKFDLSVYFFITSIKIYFLFFKTKTKKSVEYKKFLPLIFDYTMTCGTNIINHNFIILQLVIFYSM